MSPWNVSGSGLVLRASTSTESARSDGSPRFDFPGRPTTPITSPRWTSSSPVRLVSQISWIRPERSTRSTNTSLPISRRAIARPASRRVTSSSPPGLERLALGADGRDLVPVGEALGRSAVVSRGVDV